MRQVHRHCKAKSPGIDTLILVAYRPTDAIAAIASGNIIAQLLGISTKLLVLNSNIEGQLASRADYDGWIVRKGSNANYEFSGWQEGLDYLRSNDIHHRGILFANDTIGRHHHGSHLMQCNLNELMNRWSSCHGAQFIGIQHFSPQPLDLGGYDVTQWICTMIFGLTSEALKRIDYKVDHIQYAASLCSNKLDGFSILNQRAPSSIKTYIEDWLLNGGWHGSKRPPLSAHDQQRLQHKARCILCEKMLTAKARQNNISVIGVKDLEPVQARHGVLRRVVEYTKTLRAKALHQLKCVFNSPHGDIP